MSGNEASHLRMAKQHALSALFHQVCAGISDDAIVEEKRTQLTEMFEEQEAKLEEVIELCESPIERLTLVSLAFMPLQDGSLRLPALCDLAHDPFMETSRLCVVPQFTIGRYRLDFYLQWGWDERTGHAHRMCLECDGKEYHSAKQWAPDKIREGFMASFGIVTVRLTGAEIHRAEGVIADKISALVHSKGDWREAVNAGVL